MVQKSRVLIKGDTIRTAALGRSELDSPAGDSRGLAKLRELGFELSLEDCVRKLRTFGYMSINTCLEEPSTGA